MEVISDGPGPNGVVTVQYAAVLALATSLRASATGFESLADETATAQSDVLVGSGQFSLQVAGGIAAFAASWRATSEVCAESERLCAHNAGRLVLDLSATDAAMVIL